MPSRPGPAPRRRGRGVRVRRHELRAASVRDAVADLRRHLDWYQVDGVFFDRSATGAEQVRHYAGLAGRARDAGARLIVLNHGAHPVEDYADHADLLGTFEGTWDSYVELGVPRWVRSRPAGQFFHLLHAVPTTSLADAWWLAARRHAGCAYVTDRGGDNPWDGLPAGEIAATTLLARGQRSAAPGGSPRDPARGGRHRRAPAHRARSRLPAGAHPGLLLPRRGLGRGRSAASRHPRS